MNGLCLITAMDPAWLKDELKRPGRSQSGLARFMKLEHPAIVNRMCSGERKISADEADKIRAYLAGTERAGSASQPPRTNRDMAPDFLVIRHRTQAGAWLPADYTQKPLGYGPIPKDPAFNFADQWLEEVVGNSMDLIIRPGSLIHVISTIDISYSPRQDDIVSVTRTRSQGAEVERSVKQVDLSRGRLELWGRSTDDFFNRPLVMDAGLDAHENEENTDVQITGWVRHVIQRV